MSDLPGQRSTAELLLDQVVTLREIVEAGREENARREERWLALAEKISTELSNMNTHLHLVRMEQQRLGTISAEQAKTIASVKGELAALQMQFGELQVRVERLEERALT